MKRHRKRHIHIGTAVLVLAAGVSLAAAQTPPRAPDQLNDQIIHTPTLPNPTAQLQLTPEQRVAIFDAIRGEKAKSGSPIDFEVALGASVPASIELYLLPDNALQQVPEAKFVKYTTVRNQIVLVDPTTMRVVDLIRQ